MKTKISLVGLGRISKRHLEAIQKIDSFELFQVCDIDSAKAKEIGEKYNVSYCNNMLELNPDTDIISICTPSGIHPKHITYAACTNAKMIVCEKPISLTTREAMEAIALVHMRNKKLIPVFQNRYNPLIRYVKELIDKDSLGRLYQFSCNIFWNRNKDYYKQIWHGTRELDGGVLFTQASHYVDMMHFLFGELNEFKGISRGFKGKQADDTCSAIMSFNSGVVGSLNATICTYEQNLGTEFTLIAENGSISLNGINLNKIWQWNVKGIDVPNIEHNIDHIYGNGHEQLYKHIADERWEEFPSYADVVSGIRMMEKLSL